MHCDKHVVKMILESAQLLSTAVRIHVDNLPTGKLVPTILYKSTHVNHPCAIWTRESSGNFYWVSMLAKFLLEEYRRRYNKIHKSTEVIQTCYNMRGVIPTGHITPFIYCGAEDLKSEDVVGSYREYYKRDKAHILKYTNREVPEWLT